MKQKTESENKRKIILCKVEDNKEVLHVPFGLLYISDALEKKGFLTEVLHIHQKDLNKLYLKMKELNPIFVGFSTITGQSLMPTIEASKKVKEMGATVVWGGPHATLLPELCARQNYVDFVVLYEGEETVCELTFALNYNKDTENVKGLAMNKNGKFLKTPFRDFINLDDYTPNFSKLDLKDYSFEYEGLKNMLPLITSRGCPFNCGFCSNIYLNKRLWRAHSMDAVLEQANYLKENYDVDGIYFNDDLFFVDKERGKKIIEKIGLPFFVEVRANQITKDDVCWLKKNDCKCVYIGAESGSDRVLKLMNKDVTTKDLEVAVRNLNGTGIIAQLSFIAGFPGETKDDRDKTFYFIKKLKKINENIKYQVQMYAPYFGTPSYGDAIKNGFKPPNTNEEWSKIIRDGNYSLPWLRYEEFLFRNTLLFINIYGIIKQLKLSLNRFKSTARLWK